MGADPVSPRGLAYRVEGLACGGGYRLRSVAPEGRSTVSERMAWSSGCPDFSDFWLRVSWHPYPTARRWDRVLSLLCAPLV